MSAVRRVAALAALALAAAPAGAATTWTVDPAASTLTFVATQAGGEFEGRFRRFAPTIVFDATDLAHARFSVTIDTASAETGEGDRDNTLKGKDFFDVQRWPSARFETSSFRAAGNGAFEAAGRLTLRDVTREIRLPFTFKPTADGKGAVLSGGATVKRLDFGVGQGEWQDTQWVGNDVRIHFELKLKKPAP